MNIQLSDSFTYKKLIKFTFPTVLMMIFTSIYGVVTEIMAFTLTIAFILLKKSRYKY